MIVENKSDLKIGERYYMVQLPCAFIIWIEVTGFNEDTGEYNFAHVAKRASGKIELYDTFLKSNFDDYFPPSRVRNQLFFTGDDETSAKEYHKNGNSEAFNSMMSAHGLPNRLD